MTLTLRARLAAISAVVFGLLLAGLALESYEVLARSLDADATERLSELADGLHRYLRIADDTASIEFDPTDNDEAAFVHEATRYYQVYDAATGRLLAESAGFAPLGLQWTAGEVQAFRAQSGQVDIQTDYGRLRVHNSVRTASNGRAYLLQVGVSLAPLDAALAHYRRLLWWRVPIGLVCALGAGWWLSGFALRPLSRVAALAHQIDVTTLEQRLPVRGVDDELDRVVNAFNGTLNRLEHAVGEMRQFSAAMAHELRTPLAALRGEIELALRAPGTSDALLRTFASQIEEIDRLTRLIDHVLTLARAESGQIPLTRAPVDLSDLAASLVEQLESVAEARGVALRCERAGAVVVDGDAVWLRRLLLNLLGNAIKFTEATGRVVVRVVRDGDTARVEVQDSGVGLSPDAAQHVFDRFFRADPARSSSSDGAGLGLSLVQWIAAQHHGAVTVESRLGAGSTFTVTLPVASSPTPAAH